MKRSQLISIAIVLVSTLLAILLHRPRMLPVSECSHIYKKYYKTEGIDATFIRGYKLNDSVSVDVTILAATDSIHWGSLLQDFSVQESVIAFMQEHNKSVSSKIAPIGHYDQFPDSVMANNEFILVYFQKKTIYIFHLKDEVQLNAIIRYKNKKLKHIS